MENQTKKEQTGTTGSWYKPVIILVVLLLAGGALYLRQSGQGTATGENGGEVATYLPANPVTPAATVTDTSSAAAAEGAEGAEAVEESDEQQQPAAAPAREAPAAVAPPAEPAAAEPVTEAADADGPHDNANVQAEAQPPAEVSAAEATAAETSSATAAEVPRQLPYLVDLGAHSCIPCKMMMPILEELAATRADEFHTVFIDVRENPDAGSAFRIQVIPTQVFLDAERNELFRHEGFFSKDDILGTWQRLGYDFSE